MVMAIIQWVNLGKDAEYAKDPDVGSIDRCGQLSVRTKFDKNNVPIVFTVKVSPVGSDNVTYTPAELGPGRNINFKLMKGLSDLAPSTEVILDSDIYLPAAGGNKYKVEAKDANGVVVSSMEIEVRRKLYYQVLTMDDANGAIPAYSLTPMETHSKQHFIYLQKKSTEQKITYRKTLTMHPGGNLSLFGSDVGAAFNISAPLKKVGIAAVFSDYIATMGTAVFSQISTIGTPNPQFIISATEILLTGTYFLWHGLDDAEDIAKKWYVDGLLQYADMTKTPPAIQRYAIPRANVDIAGVKRFSHGGYYQIKITRDAAMDALLNQAQGMLKIEANVNIASGWTNGFSWSPGGTKLITCAKRTQWEDMPSNTKEYTWNHEVGHRFGMVAFGDRSGISGHNKLPDGPSTLYGENRGVNDKEHAGPHCEKGAVFNATTKTWSGTPGCVMFGANGTATAHAPKEYCSECSPIVRKLDLSV